ncbi:hypothetical protein [Timonella senegalensis]|uniref:hypothetical protein n=1 Tax=Timonella senegalensis TaxID=1465825 RepID=UPI0028A8D3BC|nr:hypothetical protein [Timonella senegalensis]
MNTPQLPDYSGERAYDEYMESRAHDAEYTEWQIRQQQAEFVARIEWTKARRTATWQIYALRALAGVLACVAVFVLFTGDFASAAACLALAAGALMGANLLRSRRNMPVDSFLAAHNVVGERHSAFTGKQVPPRRF